MSALTCDDPTTLAADLEGRGSARRSTLVGGDEVLRRGTDAWVTRIRSRAEGRGRGLSGIVPSARGATTASSDGRRSSRGKARRSLVKHQRRMPARVGGSHPPRRRGVLAREGRRGWGGRRRRRRRREADGSGAKVRTAAVHHPRPRGLAIVAAPDARGSLGAGRPGTTERDSGSESG
ncbi:uncharacterized protein M6B38_102405 [Iris pallida]|uniref:Uncharacterized protein n=1 Tax=Iris pallida TaxID=29817 RepID=A0AAX6IM31_IRIPA|nr:uncharacterized protein M6B38_102405 [Iris pallida]